MSLSDYPEARAFWLMPRSYWKTSRAVEAVLSAFSNAICPDSAY